MLVFLIDIKMVFIAIFFLVIAVRAQQDYTLSPHMEEFFRNYSIYPYFTVRTPNFEKNENRPPKDKSWDPYPTNTVDKDYLRYVMIIVLIVITLLSTLFGYLFFACLLESKYNRGIEERKKNFEAVYINAKQPNQGQHTFNVPIGDNTRQENTTHQKNADQANVQMQPIGGPPQHPSDNYLIGQQYNPTSAQVSPAQHKA